MKLCCGWLIVIFCIAAADAGEEVGRAWRVSDSIPVRYFVTNQKSAYSWGAAGENPVVVAPDGRHCFFVTHRGDPADDSRVAELQVFSTETIQRALASRVSVVEAVCRAEARSTWSDWDHPPISLARWTDERSITFLAVERNGGRRACQLDVRSGDRRMLTPENHDVSEMDLLRGGMVYGAATERKETTGADYYPVVALDQNNMGQVMYGIRRNFVYFAMREGSEPRPLPFNSMPYVSLAPDGKRAIVAAQHRERATWKGYERAEYIFEYMLVDLESGRVDSLFQAPTGWVTRRGLYVPHCVVWMNDGKNAVVVNTALPLEGGADRPAMSYVVDYNLEARTWTIIDEMRGYVTSAKWDEEKRTLILLHKPDEKGARAELAYVEADAEWRALPPASVPTEATPRAEMDGGIRTEFRQGANEPPHIVAVRGERSVKLSADDPALAGIWRAESKPVQWQEDNNTVTGGLMLPRNFRRGERVPLVIEAYFYDPALFRPDGPYASGYAAQALVAQGFAVLTVGIPARDRPEFTNTPREQQLFVKRVDAAVAMLAAQGIADPARVGLSGHSRAGGMTYFLITHPGKVVPAAAIVADGRTYGLFEYLVQAAWVRGDHALRNAERQMGGGKFHEDPDAWFRESPDLNLENLNTPVLFTDHHRNLSSSLIATIGAFRLAGKPMESLWFSRGAHTLQRPREREQIMTTVVDWMRFWLKGEEDPDSAKAGQYARWRKLREMHEADLKEEPKGTRN